MPSSFIVVYNSATPAAPRVAAASGELSAEQRLGLGLGIGLGLALALTAAALASRLACGARADEHAAAAAPAATRASTQLLAAGKPLLLHPAALAARKTQL